MSNTSTAKILLESTGRLLATLPYRPEDMQPGKEITWHEEGRGWQMFAILEVVHSADVALVFVRDQRWGGGC